MHGALGYAIADLDDYRTVLAERTGNEQEARVADKQAKQAAARKKTHEIGSPKIVNKVGKPLPKGVEALTIPEFLQRTVQ